MSDIIPRGDTNLQGFFFRLGIQYFLPITPPTLALHRQRLLLLLLLLLNCSRGSKINSTSAVACQCIVLWWFVVLYTCLLYAASSFTPALQQHRPTADHHYSNDRVGRDQRRQSVAIKRSPNKLKKPRIDLGKVWKRTINKNPFRGLSLRGCYYAFSLTPSTLEWKNLLLLLLKNIICRGEEIIVEDGYVDGCYYSTRWYDDFDTKDHNGRW